MNWTTNPGVQLACSQFPRGSAAVRNAAIDGDKPVYTQSQEWGLSSNGERHRNTG